MKNIFTTMHKTKTHKTAKKNPNSYSTKCSKNNKIFFFLSKIEHLVENELKCEKINKIKLIFQWNKNKLQFNPIGTKIEKNNFV